MLDVFLGYDTTSSFVNVGRATGWNLLHVYPEISSSFTSTTECDKDIDKDLVVALERFPILLYDTHDL